MSDPQREALVNVLVMSPMADHVFGSLDPISRTADVILFSGFIAQVKARTRAEVAEEIAEAIEAARELRNVRTNTHWIVNPGWMEWGQRLLKEAARIARDHGGDHP